MAARKKTPKTTHHVQARISEDARLLLAQIAESHGITQSELVRDIIYTFLFASKPGESLQGPDQGYRIAKSAANVIARRALYDAWRSIPPTWDDFQALMGESQE